MKDYVKVLKFENSISVCFYIEKEKPFDIGEKMNELNEDAYMNGYNWEAFLNYYLKKFHPDVLEGMGSDPEAGMYVAYYSLSDENQKRAEKFAQIIEDLIENENNIYDIIGQEGENIAWD